MRYAGAIVAGLVAAVVGWIAGGLAAVWLAGLFGVSDFEGQRGMFAFFVAGPITGLVAMVAAVWLVLRSGRGSASLGRVAVVLAAIAGVVGLGIALRLSMITTYTDELPPSLELELRMPAEMVAHDRDVRVALHTDHNVGDGTLFTPWPPVVDGRQVVSGSVPLAFKTTSRTLVVTIPGEPARLFRLALSRDPASTATMGAWRRANHIDRGGPDDQPVAAPAGDPVEIRYRVRRAGED